MTKRITRPKLKPGRKALPDAERIARRKAALKRARTKQLQKEKAEGAARRARENRNLGHQQERNCPAAGTLSPAQATTAGLAIVRYLGPPFLSYIDHNGKVWREDSRSAEQLIADYQRERKRKDTAR